MPTWILVLLSAMGVADAPITEWTPRERRIAMRMSPLPSVPPSPTNRFADDPGARRLGQRLFFDPALSSSGEVACSTCHDPAFGFSDGRPLAKGVAMIERHTQSLLNVAYNRWFLWDGRADSLRSQALVPMEEPREMGSTRTTVAHYLFDSPTLRAAYESLFGPLPDLSDDERFPLAARPMPGDMEHPHHRAWLGMSEQDRTSIDRVFANVGKAIAAYERQLISKNSAFDRFVDGLRENDPKKLAELSPSAQRGFRLFIGKANCRTCHFGSNFTDREFHNTRVPPLEGQIPSDPGRHRGIEKLLASPFNAKSVYSDQRSGPVRQKLDSLVNGPRFWASFKTPTLRGVSRSAPYMHQGQFGSLRRVVEYYNTLEGAIVLDHHAETVLVPLGLTEGEIDDLVSFLESLEGQPLPSNLVRRPGQ